MSEPQQINREVQTVVPPTGETVTKVATYVTQYFWMAFAALAFFYALRLGESTVTAFGTHHFQQSSVLQVVPFPFEPTAIRNLSRNQTRPATVILKRDGGPPQMVEGFLTQDSACENCLILATAYTDKSGGESSTETIMIPYQNILYITVRNTSGG